MLENLDKKVLVKANKDLNKLLLHIVDTKRGGKSNKKIKYDTGKLRNSLKTILSITSEKLELNIEAVEYYKYLDNGTKNINKPWFFTKELTTSQDFIDVVQSIYTNAFRNTVSKILK